MAELTFIRTDTVHPPLGHYVPAVVVPPGMSTVYCSGMLPKKQNGTIIEPGHPYESAMTALKNALAVVEAAGGTKTNMVKITVYLQLLKHAADVNRAFDDFFGDHFTARAMFAVVGIPLGLDLEIDVTAVV